MPDAFDHFLSFQKEGNMQGLEVKERKFEFQLSSLLSLQVSGVTRELLKILNSGGSIFKRLPYKYLILLQNSC